MTGAMYAGIAGLRTHMQNLNVIGNNVANVNTTAYKAGRSVFRTSIYTTTTGGSNGTAVVGGVNPTQIGYGSTMTNVDIDMSTGNYNVTGSSTDMMIDGDGFFLVGDKTIPKNYDGTAQNDKDAISALTLTRTGNFNFKADGYLTDGGGNVVYGFICVGKDMNGDAVFSDQLVPIRFPRVYTAIEGTGADATEVIKIGYCRAGGGIAADDVLGGENAGDANVTIPTEGRIMDYGTTSLDQESEYAMAQFTGITVDKQTGIITATSNDRNDEVITIGRIAIGTVTNPNGVTQVGDTYYKAQEGAGDLAITALGGTSNLKDVTGNVITHINKSLAPDNDAADGDAAPGSPKDPLRIRSTSKTSLLPGGLEMSKTDLAQEIANMILTQRGYQANTRIITVTDSMLEELVNMKR